MPNEKSGTPNRNTSPFQSLTQGASQLSQGGKATFSSIYQSGMQTISNMQNSVNQSFPSIGGSTGSLSETFRQGRQTVNQQLDKGIQKFDTAAVNKGRDMVKLQPDPNDGLVRSFQKKAFNFGTDVVADNMETITRNAKSFSAGVKNRVVSTTIDRLNPMHMTNMVTHPDLVKRYAGQRAKQLMQPVDFLQDPKGFTTEKYEQLKNSMWNATDRMSELDGGPSSKLAHGARALVDSTQETIAPIIGTSAITLGLYNLPNVRAKTNKALDQTFPKDRMYGKFARLPLQKFLVSKPLSRVRGNPMLTMGILGYSAMTSIGKSIGDSLRIQNELPDTYRRLKANKTEMYRSSGQLDQHESIQRTSKKNGSY